MLARICAMLAPLCLQITRVCARAREKFERPQGEKPATHLHVLAEISHNKALLALCSSQPDRHDQVLWSTGLNTLPGMGDLFGNVKFRLSPVC